MWSKLRKNGVFKQLGAVLSTVLTITDILVTIFL